MCIFKYIYIYVLTIMYYMALVELRLRLVCACWPLNSDKREHILGPKIVPTVAFCSKVKYELLASKKEIPKMFLSILKKGEMLPKMFGMASALPKHWFTVDSEG